MSANLENSAVATRLENVSFHSSPKEGQCQRMFILPYNCTHFTCKVKLKILQAKQYGNWELSDIQAEFKEKRNQRSNHQHLLDLEKAREFQKNISISASLTTLKPLTMWITTNCGKFLKRWEYQNLSPEKPICQFFTGIQNRIWKNWLVQNWERSTSKLYIVTLFIYMQYIMQNARLDE